MAMQKPVRFTDVRSVKFHQMSFSGGRTSGRMLREWMNAMGGVPSNSMVLFANTGREEDATLDFIHEVETQWGVPIVWLEYDRVPASSIDLSVFPTPRRAAYVRGQASRDEDTHWFKVVNYETAHRIGQPNSPFDKVLEWMSVLPNPRVRSCSAQLKTRTMMRYIWTQRIYEFTSYIGYRADEADRGADLLNSRDLVQGNTFCFPLIDMGVREEDVMDFWSKQPFDLMLKQHEGNCDLCFMKSVPKRIEIMRRKPHRAKWWIDWENKKTSTASGNGGQFRLEQRYEALLERSKTALPMFSDDEYSDSCGACTTGAMEWNEDEE